MPSTSVNKLLESAANCIKLGNFETARQYLEQVLIMSNNQHIRCQARYLLSKVTDDLVQQREALVEALILDPAHAEALQAMAVLDEKQRKAHAQLSQITGLPVQSRNFIDAIRAINPAYIRAHRIKAIMDGKLKLEDFINPKRIPLQPTGERNATARRFACPKCGSRMLFDADGHALACESCARQEALNPAAAEAEQDFVIAMANGQSQRKPVAMNVFICKGCSARVLLPPESISTTCAYCGSVYVLVGMTELVEPDSIIPMTFNWRQAALRLVQWVKQHKITPQGKVQAPRGLHLPVWTFDIAGSIPWHSLAFSSDLSWLNSVYGPAANSLSRFFRTNSPLHEVIQSLAASGDREVYFDDLIVPATSKLGGLFELMLREYTYSSAAAYDPRYLAGWPAEIYETTMAQASLKARGQVADEMLHTLNWRLGRKYEYVSDLAYSTAGLVVVSFKLVLVPVWVTEYMLENRQFRVLINGQNGAVHGETPFAGINDSFDEALGA